MNLPRLCVISGLTAIALLVGGCAGYQLGEIKPSTLAHLDSVAVPTFKNQTLEPRSQVLVTNEVIKQLQRDGSYKIGNVATADAILHGTITQIDRRQLRSSRTDVLRTSEIEIILQIDFVLEDAETGAELEHGSVTGRTSIYLDPNFQLSERQALQLAAEKAAQRLTSQLTEGF